MRSLVNLLVVALAYVQSNITDAGEYRASSYVFGTLARITVVDDDPARAQRAAASMFREFDRMHRDLHAWQPGELVALNEAIARGETHVATTAEIAALIQEARRFSERSGELFNHYSLLRTTENLLGLPALGAAAGARSMAKAFALGP